MGKFNEKRERGRGREGENCTLIKLRLALTGSPQSGRTRANISLPQAWLRFTNSNPAQWTSKPPAFGPLPPAPRLLASNQPNTKAVLCQLLALLSRRRRRRRQLIIKRQQLPWPGHSKCNAKRRGSGVQGDGVGQLQFFCCSHIDNTMPFEGDQLRYIDYLTVFCIESQQPTVKLT